MEIEREGDAEVTGQFANFTVNFLHPPFFFLHHHFLHLLDTATKTANILHCDMSALNQVKSHVPQGLPNWTGAPAV